MVRICRIFKELSSSENDELDALLNSRISEHVVTYRFNIPNRLSALCRLKDDGSLNNEIFNYYIELLNESSASQENYFHQTYFYGRLRDH